MCVLFSSSSTTAVFLYGRKGIYFVSLLFSNLFGTNGLYTSYPSLYTFLSTGFHSSSSETCHADMPLSSSVPKMSMKLIKTSREHKLTNTVS